MKNRQRIKIGNSKRSKPIKSCSNSLVIREMDFTIPSLLAKMKMSDNS